jgi:HrpA-like RNA helicase
MDLFDPIAPQIPLVKDKLKNQDKFPINMLKMEILNSLNINSISFIAGESGSGKTTQTGQYILELCELNKRKCRIICAVPYELIAYYSALRVSEQLGEDLGHTVGCHLFNNEK